MIGLIAKAGAMVASIHLLLLMKYNCNNVCGTELCPMRGNRSLEPEAEVVARLQREIILGGWGLG